METDEDFTTDNSPISPSANQTSLSPIDQAEIDGLLVEYPYAAEPSYFTRPNRYHGPPSTWRSWTANDRDIAESLDVARAEDLSAHLYNAFDLKRRSRADQAARTLQIKDRSNGNETLDDEDEAAGQQFTPPDVWTTWPLRSRHVPRESYLGTAAQLDRLEAETSMPSAPLADALLAITLRHARERWEARSKEPKVPQSGPSKYNWKNERNLTKKEMTSHEANKDGHDTSAHHQSDEGGSVTGSETMSNADDTVALNEKLPPGTQLFSSQAFAALDTSSSEDESSTTGSEENEPAFSADDEQARQLLQPTIRHVLTRFDDLLGGLHEARAAYAYKTDHSRSRSRSRFSDAETTADDEQFVRSGSRAASVKRGRKRKRAPSESRDVEGKQQDSRSRGRSTTGKSEKKSQPLAPRDWSDVMGIAILKGWNVETVARASERCAKLFGQNMAFRTFHQGTEEKDTVPREEPWFEETLAYVPTQYKINVQDEPQTAKDEFQSIKSRKIECVRTSSPCSRCRIHRIRCQPSNPVSADNLSNRVPCSACSSLTNPAALCSGIAVRPRPNTTDKTCPYPDCPRHAPARPFAKKYHLQRHLTDVHGHIYSPPTSPAPSTPANHEQSNIEHGTPEQIRLNTTLTCPIPSCPQSTRVFRRTTRLYDHIRNIHPEFDVNSLKKIVAKAGERGKYDRSRSRSRQVTTTRAGDVNESDNDGEESMEEQSRRVTTDVGVDGLVQQDLSSDH